MKGSFNSFSQFYIIISLFLSTFGEGKTLYVSVEGNDNNHGTRSDPFKSISQASKIAEPGDTVFVMKGIYRERVAPPKSGTEGKPITYKGSKLGEVFIKGSDEWSPSWKRHQGNIYFAAPSDNLFKSDDVYIDDANPFKVPLASTPYDRQGKPEFERTGDGDPNISYTCGQVIINGKPWIQKPLLKELANKSGNWFYQKETGLIFINFGNLKPKDQLIEISTRRRIFAPHSIGIGHIIVEGFVMEHCGNQYPTNFWSTPKWAQAGALGLRGGHHWIVRNNVIRYAGADAIDMGSGGGQNERSAPRIPGAPLGLNNVIEKNYIIENGAGGIIGANNRNIIIRDNVIMYNNTLGFIGKKRYEHGGIKSHDIKEGLITRNYVANNPLSEGIWLDNQFPNTRVTKNISYNNGSRGIFLEMSNYKFDTALIDHNISIGNQRIQFYVHDASGSTVMHNLFANSPKTAKYGQGTYIYQVNARTNTGYHSLYNNFFINHRKMMDINYPSHRSGPQRLDHNVYDGTPEERTFIINSYSDRPSPWKPDQFFDLVKGDIGKGNPTPIDGGSKVAMTISDWRNFWSKHGQENDTNSIITEGINVSYNETNQTLTINLPEGIKFRGSTNYNKISTDYEGNRVPQNGKANPGPFQSLKPGKNTFKIWNGLPLVARGQLPKD